MHVKRCNALALNAKSERWRKKRGKRSVDSQNVKAKPVQVFDEA